MNSNMFDLLLQAAALLDTHEKARLSTMLSMCVTKARYAEENKPGATCFGCPKCEFTSTLRNTITAHLRVAHGTRPEAASWMPVPIIPRKDNK